MKITKYDKPIGHVKPSVPTWDREKTPCPKRDKPRAKGKKGPPKYKLKLKEKNAMCWYHLCIATGKCYSAWWYQVNRYGMTPLEALKSRHSHVVMSLRDVCRKVGIGYDTFQHRRKSGWEFREALLTPVDEIQSEAAKSRWV